MGRSKKATGSVSQVSSSTEGGKTWAIEITPTALRMLGGITDIRSRKAIAKRIDELAHNPDQLGKPLLGELGGYRSIRAAGQRFRIVYRVEGEKVVVMIVAVGIRKQDDKSDIYELTKKLLRLRLLE